MNNFCDLYVILQLNKESQNEIHNFFISNYGITRDKLLTNLHVTIYYGRRLLKGLRLDDQYVSFKCNVSETRFMTMTPGGENPRKGIIPSQRTIGVRLTRRNICIPRILEIRRRIYKLEPKFEKRQNTTDWKNSFGSREYQPHISLLRPHNGLENDLREVGKNFRRKIKYIKFSKVIANYKQRKIDTES